MQKGGTSFSVKKIALCGCLCECGVKLYKKSKNPKYYANKFVNVQFAGYVFA